jgi:hypothetical protein
MSAQAERTREKRFDWPLCYDAENYLLARIEAFTERNSFARRLAHRMRNETGTLLLDWVDYLVVPHAEEKRLRGTGFTDDPLGEAPGHLKALWHPEAMLPRVLVERDTSAGRIPETKPARAAPRKRGYVTQPCRRASAPLETVRRPRESWPAKRRDIHRLLRAPAGPRDD